MTPRRYVRLYLALMALNLRASWQFPGQTMLRMGMTIILEGLQLLVLWVVLDRFGSVGGWTFWEVALLLALKDLAHTVYFQLFWTGGLDTAVIHGELDKLLVRPMHPLIHFLADHEQSPARFPMVLFGVALITLASTQIQIEWTLLKLAGLTIGFASGVLIFTGIQLLGSSLAFWTKREDTLTVFLPWVTDTFTQYPLHIYGTVVLAVLTFALPFAFMNFIPVAFVIDRGGDLLFTPYLVFAAPAVALLLLGLGHLVWNRGLRVYESAGT